VNRRRVVCTALTAAIAVACAPAAQAQIMSARPDATPRDTAGRDTTVRELVKWAEPDSVMSALLDRRGYTATRYQGDRVVFDARVRTLDLTGDPGAVGRGATLVVGDTILYSDVTKLVVVRGDTNILRDPSQNAEDVVSRGSLTYNISTRRGSVSNISTAVESGERWFVSGVEAAFVSDTTGRQPTTFFVREGDFTTCDDSVPHYFFRAGRIKMVSKTLLVARPAVLYIGEVPVLWLPFMFQDIRSGRRSGILTPRFGVSEIFRNSPQYRRHVDNIGYYFALSDYTDARLWLDWRSGARPTEGDPGWIKYNGEFQYRWLSRFMTGRFAASHDRQRSGGRNTALSWAHQQNFSQTRNLSFNLNYVTNTFIQRSNAFDPRQVMATISSQANYAQKLGPASLTIGGNRRQYPGRDQVDQQFPNFNLVTPTLALARWLEWTPSLSVINDQNFNLDQPGTVSFRYLLRESGLDSIRVGDRRATNLTFNTPLKIFGFTWSNSFRVADSEDDYPTSVQLASRTDSGVFTTRVFSRTYRTNVDWETSIGLPGLLVGTWNVSPSISFSNVDGAPYMVRTQFSGGRFVRQSKRAIYGVGVSPTFFGLFPGFGPVERFRHSISPRLSYGYAPAARVSDEFLAATNSSGFGYNGGLAQNKITLQLSQNIEAKLRAKPDSATGGNISDGAERKIRLLSINLSPLAYDFERARATGRSGFATDRLSYDLTSDLLPGFSLRSQYSLFQGNLQSDSAVFKPFRESLDVSFTLNQQSGILAAFSRLFGRAVPQRNPQIERLEPAGDDALSQKAGSTPVAGVAARDRMYGGMQATQGFQASFRFSSQRQRPPVGGNVIDYDPAVNCRIYEFNPIAYTQCLVEQQTNPTSATPFDRPIGSAFVRTPPRENINSQMSFNITPTWSATWGTNYDFQAKAFGNHTVGLQRDLHDWRSTFAFTKAPNGNFSFSFFISLKAQPDLKFDYDKQTYRRSTPVR
jgi:hypothetical protein